MKERKQAVWLWGSVPGEGTASAKALWQEPSPPGRAHERPWPTCSSPAFLEPLLPPRWPLKPLLNPIRR